VFASVVEVVMDCSGFGGKKDINALGLSAR